MALRVATFNILFGDSEETGPGSWVGRRPLIVRAIAEARPDVIGLQEVLPSMLRDLDGAFGELGVLAGPTSGPSRFDIPLPARPILAAARALGLPRTFDPGRPRSERVRVGEHLPILFRPARLRPTREGAFWISGTPEQPGSLLGPARTPFMVHWAEFEDRTQGGSFVALNAHFGHAPWHYPPTVRTIERKVGELAGPRGAGREGAEMETPPARDVFLFGDFNAWPSNPLVRRLTSPAGAGFVDAAAAAAERTGPAPTFHWGTGSSRLGLRLDHVLARTRRRPARAEVVDVHEGRAYPSDHRPLVVEFDEPRSGS